jgi:hypothetical protein
MVGGQQWEKCCLPIRWKKVKKKILNIWDSLLQYHVKNKIKKTY